MEAEGGLEEDEGAAGDEAEGAGSEGEGEDTGGPHHSRPQRAGGFPLAADRDVQAGVHGWGGRRARGALRIAGEVLSHRRRELPEDAVDVPDGGHASEGQQLQRGRKLTAV